MSSPSASGSLTQRSADRSRRVQSRRSRPAWWRTAEGQAIVSNCRQSCADGHVQ